jgi:hypothetical protein
MRLPLFLTLGILLLASNAHAQRAVQVAPDGKLMVNKLFAGQQWSIVVDFDTQSMAGNVFNTDGSDPQFVWCEIIDPTINDPSDFVGLDAVTLDCQGADGCGALPCPPTAWAELGELDVIGSFFVPPAGATGTPGRTPTPNRTATPQRTPTPQRTATPQPSQFDPPCDSPVCGISHCNSVFENNCPEIFRDDGILCDCGCQFRDPDCFNTPTPSVLSRKFA